jgi:2-polyprenyl-6-methoxyphenol hydroxylase-like FAD-dependent oxidoreductase
MNPNYDAILSADQDTRAGLFTATAQRLGTTPQNAEKDFWVCWTLDALFNGLPDGPRLLFKGGTSLSKGFGLIRRFSEDIDITVFRDDLGEAASVEELQALSRKKRDAALDAIKAVCETYINGPLLEQLSSIAAATADRIGLPANWLRVTPHDEDSQTLLILYPTATPADGYIDKAVKIESGAKSALDPNAVHSIRPYAPRAKTTNIRTRTHLRRWGIADRLAANSPFGVDYPSDVHFVTRLSGPALAHFPNAFNASPEIHPDYPEHAQWVPQYVLERVLREHVATLCSVDLRFNTEFVACQASERGVRVVVRPSGERHERVLQARFLIGADGARSSVRDAIGATMSGTYGLSRNYNIVFRAPGLANAHRHAPGIMYWQVNADVPSLIGPMDRDDVWFFMPTGVQIDEMLSDAQARALIARATGIDAEYEILSSDLWVASRLIADRYRDGPIFLVGDACHLHPPFGGYGMPQSARPRASCPSSFAAANRSSGELDPRRNEKWLVTWSST